MPTYLSENLFVRYSFICEEYKTNLEWYGIFYSLIDISKYIVFTLIIAFLQNYTIP